MSDSLWPHGRYSSWNSPGQNTGVGSLSLLQGVFPTQGLNPGDLHCGWILYQLNYKERRLSFTDSFSRSFLSSWPCHTGMLQNSALGLLFCFEILFLR